MFVRLKNRQELSEARLVGLADRGLSAFLDPLRVLLAQSVMNLVLKLNVRANAGAARICVHFHLQIDHRS